MIESGPPGVPPKVFDVLPGAAGSPVVLHVPHGSRVVTAAARAGIVLDDAALERELDLLTDAHTREIAEAAADRGDRPWIFANRYSRLVVDPERFPDDSEEMARVGMAAVYTRTAHGAVLRDGADRDELIESHYAPYAAGMTDLVGERLRSTGRAVLIDVHSYQSVPLPYELHADGPRPEICLGTDGFHTPPGLLSAARRAFGGFELGTDSPFAGTYVPLKYYRRDGDVQAIMIEIRRDVYMTEIGGPTHEGLARVAAALGELIQEVSR